jgi:branched-chain amino acid transport system substrate-binding protein
MIKPILYAALPLMLAGGATAAFAADPIKIGVTAPLSGSYAAAGIDIVDGGKQAAAKINAAGGVLGRQIVLVPEDDGCDAQMGAQAAQKIADDGVVAVAGSYCSGAALPEVTALHRAGIAYVLDGATNPKLTEMGLDTVFRTIGRDDEQGPFAANYIANFLHAKTAAVIDDNTTYSKGLADNTVAALKKYGVNVVYFDAITPGQMDYSAVLSHVASLHPDVIDYTGYFAEAGLIAKQAAALHIKAKMMGGDATNDPTLIKTAGPGAEGWTSTTAPLPEFLSGAKDYVTNYTKAYGKPPGPYSVYEYDAVAVIAQAIADAKSVDPAAITAALHKIKDFPGITGNITFNEKGDRATAVYITIDVKNGAFVAGQKLDADGKWVSVQ